MENVEEIRSNIKKVVNSYKVKYENENFEFGFGKYNKVSNKLEIHTEFNLEVEEFKEYFSSILRAIFEYNEQTGKDFIKELIENND